MADLPRSDDSLSPGARKLMGGLSTVNRVLIIGVPGALAVLGFVIGVAVSSAGIIATAVVVGLVAGYAWMRSLGTRDAPNGK